MKPLIARLVPSAVVALLLAASVFAAPAANAGPTIRGREIVGDLNQPVAFTFGPGRKIWYVEKTTGEVRVHDLDNGADRRFVRVRGVSGVG